LPSEDESLQMKKFISILLISAFFSVIAVNAFAEGDKNCHRECNNVPKKGTKSVPPLKGKSW